MPGQPHTLSCQATGQLPMTYIWYKNGQQLVNTNSPTLEIPAFRDDDVGSYCCRISNANGPDAISEFAELAVGKCIRSVT